MEINLVTQAPWGWLSLLPCITPPSPSLLFLGYFPQIDCLYTNSCLQLCFWRNPKPQLSFLFFPSLLFLFLLFSLSVSSTPQSTSETACPRPTECEGVGDTISTPFFRALVSASSHHRGRGGRQGRREDKEKDARGF